jgi:hypothetical protein
MSKGFDPQPPDGSLVGAMKRQLGIGPILLCTGAAFIAALVLAAVVLAAIGTGERGLSIALQLTGRWMFLLFWLAYTGSAMAALFGSTFGALERCRRVFGLCFASALLVHLALVVWLFRISGKQPIPNTSILLFSTGVVCTIVLTLYSVKRVRDALNPKLWRVLRVTGLEYIAFLFLADFVINPIQNGVKHPIGYAPISIMILVGPLLRLAAFIRTSRQIKVGITHSSLREECHRVPPSMCKIAVDDSPVSDAKIAPTATALIPPGVKPTPLARACR